MQCLERLATLCVASLGLLQAATITQSLDPELFGDLNQADTNCPRFGCGQASAVNSLAYLQRKYPRIYGRSLIPDRDFSGRIETAELIPVANDIGRNFMKTCNNCTVSMGTVIEDFILGKRDYMEAKARGKTRYAAQIFTGGRLAASGFWREDAGTHPGTKKPDFVKDNTKPTLAFLATQIKMGEDVEVFIANLDSAHYVTVTGITYDDTTNRGTLSFVDPMGGTRGTRNILGLDTGFIATDYKLNNRNTFVFSAVSESPVPEPSTLLVVGSALLLFLKSGRQHLAVRIHRQIRKE
jgi:hypothetical protein